MPRAANYLQDAQLLLARNRQESAASLLYEAAKSSINAIANLHGENPGPTANKTRVFREVTAHYRYSALLQTGWDTAQRLHTHCDQHFLDESDLNNGVPSLSTSSSKCLPCSSRKAKPPRPATLRNPPRDLRNQPPPYSQTRRPVLTYQPQHSTPLLRQSGEAGKA